MAIVTIAIIVYFLFSRICMGNMEESNARVRFVSNFITLYRQQTGITLTYDQAIALIQVAAMMEGCKKGDCADAEPPTAQSVVERLCAEAEMTVLKRNQQGK